MVCSQVSQFKSFVSWFVRKLVLSKASLVPLLVRIYYLKLRECLLSSIHEAFVREPSIRSAHEDTLNKSATQTKKQTLKETNAKKQIP